MCNTNLLGTGVFGHSLGAFRHGVFGQFTGQQETNSCLNFPRRDGRAFVVVRQTRRFGSDTLEDVVHERIPAEGQERRSGVTEREKV